jgi:hypothetical protein
MKMSLMMKRIAAALAAAAVVSLAALVASAKKAPVDAGRNDEAAAEAEGLLRRVDALEAGNAVLARDLLYMTAKNEEAIVMAENLLVFTRLSYPMKREEIIEQLAGYQTALLALLDKLREVK